MIGMVMAGGRASRMNLPQEKPLLVYKKPIVLHVLDALHDSGCFSRILAATSPNSPHTGDLITGNGYDTVKTPGNGFVEDLYFALKSLDCPALVVPADLPLLDGQIIRRIVQKCNMDVPWTSILVRKDMSDSMGLSPGPCVECDGIKCRYTGISMVNPSAICGMDAIPETYAIIDDRRIAFNMNTRQDYDLLDTA